MNYYCLFQGRHQLPPNEGALFASFDFSTFTGVKTPLYKAALEDLRKGLEVLVYVTGLTPALTEFLSDASLAIAKNIHAKLILAHHDNSRLHLDIEAQYRRQIFGGVPETTCYYCGGGHSNGYAVAHNSCMC